MSLTQHQIKMTLTSVSNNTLCNSQTQSSVLFFSEFHSLLSLTLYSLHKLHSIGILYLVKHFILQCFLENS